MDEEVDSISTIAQLMTFTQLFGALLMRLHVLENIMPIGVASGFLIGSALSVPGFSMLARLYESSETIIGGILLLGAYIGALRYKKMEEKKEEEENSRALERRPSQGTSDEASGDNDEKDGEKEDATVLDATAVQLEVMPPEEQQEYELAKKDAVAVIASSSATCQIKVEAEKELVKRWIGLHITHLV